MDTEVQKNEHTPGPWRQGVTLMTEQTRRWTPEQILANDAREQLQVFAFFTGEDHGRGRRLVAQCRTEEDARLIAAAPELLAACKAAVPIIQHAMTMDMDGSLTGFGDAQALEQCIAAIAKVRAI